MEYFFAEDLVVLLLVFV